MLLGDSFARQCKDELPRLQLGKEGQRILTNIKMMRSLLK